MSVTSNRLIIGTDPNYTPTFSINFMPDNLKYMAAMSPATELTLVVPGNVDTALFSFTAPTVWVSEGTVSAVLPAGGFTLTATELNPGQRNVTPGETLHFISAINVEVGVMFVRVNS